MADENPDFRLKPIAEFLDGNYHFLIPSYQRGYRWNKKEVEDLLKDICDFARKAKEEEFYCLQPIVVKKQEDTWIVIDGQQRLTTLLLILNFLKQTSQTDFVQSSIVYKIRYDTRSSFDNYSNRDTPSYYDFSDPKKDTDIDSFHIFQAKAIIEDWFKKTSIRRSKLEDILFLCDGEDEKNSIPQVKVIWYVAKKETDIDSIKIFNNLNKGKIRLTNAELIKALFILKSPKVSTWQKKRSETDENLNLYEFAYEWNEIENSLHNDNFWYFLANKDYTPATRIDIIFDFLTGNKGADFAYRKFQDLFDNPNDLFWTSKQISTFSKAWEKVLELYHAFVYWYEDSTTYHYIGYLINNGEKISEIYTICNNELKSEIVEKLCAHITSKLNLDKSDIDDLSYSDNSSKCKELLLLFNIETCVQKNTNQHEKIYDHNKDKIAYYKFPFDLYKLNDWDIEHVNSQTENQLKKVPEKIDWLRYIKDISCQHEDWVDLQKRAAELITSLQKKDKDEDEKFNILYKEICNVFQPEQGDKDSIDNLTLLDAGTNRGYGNALFPTKRSIIIKKDTEGTFIPPCTKKLFLKYYTDDCQNSSQWKNTWNDDDRKGYLKAIHDTIGKFFNEEKR